MILSGNCLINSATALISSFVQHVCRVLNSQYSEIFCSYFQPGLIIIGYTVPDRNDGRICSKGKPVGKVGKPRTGQLRRSNIIK